MRHRVLEWIPRRVNNFGYSRYLATNKNMYDMKPNTYHSMHQIERLSVSVSSKLAQKRSRKSSRENTLADETFTY